LANPSKMIHLFEMPVIGQLDRALDLKHQSGRQRRRSMKRTSLLTSTRYKVISLMVLDLLSYAYQRDLWNISLAFS
jgi:hypothetical protein